MKYIPPGRPGRIVEVAPRYENFIGGKWLAPTEGHYRVDVSPVDGSAIAEVASSTPGRRGAGAGRRPRRRGRLGRRPRRGRQLRHPPVAGRMPGHMNVLLAEANAPYTQLKDLNEINPQFASTDVLLVVGADDVTNPAARHPGNAVSGMPILDVDNELYTDPGTAMLFGDAKVELGALLAGLHAYVA